MSVAVTCELLLYDDDDTCLCLLFMGKDTKEFEDKLARDFSSLCECFVYNKHKLTIHFREKKLNLFFLVINVI